MRIPIRKKKLPADAEAEAEGIVKVWTKCDEYLLLLQQ